MIADEKRGLESRIIKTGMIRNRGFDDEVSSFFRHVELEKILHPDKKVLELGCGYGNILKYLSKKYKIIPYGLDLKNFNSNGYEILSSAIQRRRPINLKEGSITNIPLKENFFDFIFSYMTFMYLDDKLKGISECHKVMKIGATALIDIQGCQSPLEGINPKIQEIITAYPNSGQIVPIQDNKNEESSKYCRYIIIHKTSKDPLHFPKLIKTELHPINKCFTNCFYDF
jgi:ubiquinone/menaquinone biosynthesis C-methylase UbiE